MTTTISSTDSAFLVRSASPATVGRTLAAVGRDRPVVFDELMAAPLVLRHKDVSAALRNAATFSTGFYGVGPMATAMIAQNGAEHSRQRRIQNRFFSPAASARYAARVIPVARREFGALAGRPRAELVDDVMARYPMAVFLETTIQMLSGTIAGLLSNPDALAAVRADRTLVDAAIGESFRWANPSAGLYRLVTRDTELPGTPMAAGSMVYLCIAAAHFDAAAHPDPERFDLARSGGHLGFGLGPHYCVGAPLAKIEVAAALDALLDVAPGLRFDPERPPEFHYGARGFVQHGTEAMHVLLT